MALENALVLTFKDKLKRDVLVIPSLPEVALSVCDAVEQQDVALRDVADLIARDAGMAARMIKISNSALFSSVVKIKTVQDACNRVGLKSIKSIAMAMAMEQLYVSQSEVVFRMMEANWQKAMKVASAATALLLVHPGKLDIPKELVTLAGVVHNIGCLPILFELEKMPKVPTEPETIQKVIQKLQTIIGTHLLTVWEFDEAVVEVIKQIDLQKPTEDELSVADFVVAGELAVQMAQDETEELQEKLAAFVEKGVVEDASILVSPDYLANYRDTFNSLSH